MTSLRTPIAFNNSTGSDTAASGVGPSTALTGSAASFSGAVVTLDGSPNLSGVQAGDLLYLNTSTGRKFFVIASVNDPADQVTLDLSPAGTSTGRSWAIGGKRATLDHADSRLIFSADWVNGTWSAELQYTGTDYTLSTNPLTLGELAYASFRLFGTGGRPIVRQTSNAAAFDFSGGGGTIYWWRLERLQITNSNGSKSGAHGVYKSGGVAGGLHAFDVIFGDATNYLQDGVSWGGSAFSGISLYGCEFKECGNIALNGGAQHCLWDVIGCEIHDSGSHGIYGFGGQQHGRILNCVIDNNGGEGIYLSNDGITPNITIAGCTIHGNAGDGIEINSGELRMTICNNLLTSNGGYGINMSAAHEWYRAFINFNAFRSNTSGARNNLTAGPNDVTLSADPYTNSGSRDFSLNNTAGGGAAAKAAGFPGALPSGLTSYLDIGAVQRQEPTGGGIAIIRRGGLHSRM